MPVLTAGGPALVHFFDFAQLNSVRTLPYVVEWDRRYRDAGLRTIGVQAPRFPFGADPEAVADGPRAARGRVPGRDRLRARPLALLRLRGLAQPLPLEPRRSAELVPLRRGRIRRAPRRRSRPSCASRTPCAGPAGADGAAAGDRRPRRAGDGAERRALPRRLLGAALDRGRGRRGAGRPLRGRAAPTRRSRDEGELAVELDGAAAASRSRSTAPALYDLAEHPRHESHELVLRPSPGLRVWSVSFAAGVP